MTYVIQWSSQINGDTGTYAPGNIGKNTIDIVDNTTDTSTSLTLTGKGWSGYGAIQQENFIRLMENFASESPPQNESTGGNPTAGQLWYNTAQNTLSLYTIVAPSSNPTFEWSQVFPAVIDSNSVITALGFTPYNSSNPDEFISQNGTGGYPLSSAILGTANEIIVTANGSGVLTLSTPQAIGTTSTPTFAQITVNNSPVNTTDVTTKGYVDAATTGLSWKNSVQCATTVNITLSGLQTIDTYTTLAGDRVLVKNQSDATQNGIYVASSGAWARSADTNTGLELEGAAVYVNNGSTGTYGQMNTAWTCTNGGTITIGTTDITWAQFGGGQQLVAGAGISITGNTVGNTGAISLTAGSGISISGSANYPTISINGSGAVTAIYGSSNVNVSGNTGGVTISLPSTCSINITGNSNTVGGFGASQSSGTPNRVVVADGSGYINNTYFNSSDNVSSSGMSGVMGKFGDNYLRTGTAQAVASFISGSSMNISGNATTATTASSANALNSANGYTIAGLLVNGNINATGNIGAYYSSDARLKTNIKPIADALNKIDQIRGVEFDWISESVESCGLGRKHDVGVIAQEIEAVLPEVVITRDDGTKAVKYERMVSLLLQAIKELKEKVETLEAKG